MNTIFRQIASFSLALLVLFSTMSFTVGMHYCGKTLIDFSLFDEVDTCGMETMQVPDDSDCSFVVDDCCKDENLIVEGQDNIKVSFDNLGFQQQVFVVAYTYSFLSLVAGDIENIVPFRYYEPPLLVRDIHVLDETFLI